MHILISNYTIQVISVKISHVKKKHNKTQKSLGVSQVQQPNERFVSFCSNEIKWLIQSTMIIVYTKFTNLKCVNYDKIFLDFRKCEHKALSHNIVAHQLTSNQLPINKFGFNVAVCESAIGW